MSEKVTVHMRSPSGTGSYTLCGAKEVAGEDNVITALRKDVTCPKCLDALEYPLTRPRAKPKPKAVAKDNGHYDVGGVSTIDVIKAKLTSEQYHGFLLGNVIKYALRLNHKGTPEGDARKLAEYSRWLSQYLEETSFDE